MKKKGSKLIALLVACIILIVSGCGNSEKASKDTAKSDNSGQASQKKITIRAISAWEETNQLSSAIFLFQKKVKEKSNGKLEIKYIGGPEVVSANEQAEAVKNGIADMALTTSAYYQSHMPESAALDFSQITAQEERQNGAFAFLNQIHEQKVGVSYIGRAPGRSYALYTIAPVKKMEDLKGMLFRATGIYIPLLDALGAKYTNIPGGEVYGALERGVVKAIAWPEMGITDAGWQEVLKYKILPTYLQTGSSFIMNKDVLKNLPEDLKKVIEEVAIEVEKENPAIMRQIIEKEDKLIKSKGMQIVTLEDGEKYKALANEAAWKWLKTKAPDNGEKLEKLLKK